MSHIYCRRGIVAFHRTLKHGDLVTATQRHHAAEEADGLAHGADTAGGLVGLPGLRATRERKLLTQDGLALAAGLHRSTVCELEVGRRNAHFDTLRQLAAALGVEPQVLLAPPAVTRRRGKRSPGRPRKTFPAPAASGAAVATTVGSRQPAAASTAAETAHGRESQTGA
jgi:DNA-binding XRE family transcriptional regulator